MRAAAVVVAAALAATPALPCTLVFIDPFPDAAAALDGKHNVPPNLVILAPSPVAAATRLFVQRDDGSERTELVALPAADLLPLHFEASLRPSTSYELRCSSADAPEVRCAAFTTLAADDLTAPAAPLVTATAHGEYDPVNPCTHRDDTAVDIEIAPATESDVTLAAFVRTLAGTRQLLGWGPVEPNGVIEFHDASHEGGDAIYEVTAFDDAGNASEPTIIEQSLGCDGSCAQADAAPFGFTLVALFLIGSRKRTRT